MLHLSQVNEMRVDMIRGSMAAPESLMRILSDYPMQVTPGSGVAAEREPGSGRARAAR